MRVPAAVWRAAHDAGLAAWFGGAYFGALALNGASREVDEPSQRGRVANAGWFRWAAVLPVAIGAHLIGAAGLTARRHCDASPHTTLSWLRLGATVVALLGTVESGRSGRQVVRGGDVPVATAVQPISDTPEDVARAMRRLRVVQWLIPVATLSVIVLDAVQQQGTGTRLAPRFACWLAQRAPFDVEMGR